MCSNKRRFDQRAVFKKRKRFRTQTAVTPNASPRQKSGSALEAGDLNSASVPSDQTSSRFEVFFAREQECRQPRDALREVVFGKLTAPVERSQLV
jgi:hypothetical protein